MRKADLLIAAMAVGVTACGSTCLDVERTRPVFEAAWRNDVAGMRAMLDRDPSLVDAHDCQPKKTVGSWLAQRAIGEDAPRPIHGSGKLREQTR